MKSFWIISFLFLVLLSITCPLRGIDFFSWIVSESITGSGQRDFQTRDLQPVDEIVIDISGNFVITPGNHVCKLTGDDNILPLIETDCRDGRLFISSKKSISPKTPLEITIELPSFHAVKLNGSADIYIKRFNGQSLTLKIDGSGDIEADGQTEQLDAVLNGSGNLGLQKLKAGQVDVLINGSGDASVVAEKSLTARINGSGDITYYGDPEFVHRDINGSGSIFSKTTGE